MAQVTLDTTLNQDMGNQLGKVNDMMTELYAASSTTPTPSVTSLTASGAISGATVTSTGLATAGSAKLDTGTKTASATGGAATLNKSAGVITSEALTTAAGATYTLTLTNSTVAAADQVFASVQYGSATAGTPCITRVTPGSSSVVIVVQNIHASAALDGTIKISYMVLKN